MNPQFLNKLRSMQRRDWELMAMILAIKVLIFVFAVKSYRVWEDKPVVGPRGWLEIWNRWDAINYLKLAQYGYSATGETKPLMVFYPLFPWIVRWFALLSGDYLVSAFFVSSVTSITAGFLLQRLVQLDYSRALAQRTVWFLFIFPTSYFLHIGYTESLFLTLTLGCFLAARKQRWLFAGLLGALACLTRATGLVLIPALTVEAAQQYWTTRRWQWQWLWIGIVAFGFGSYLLLNARVAGDPFAFLPIRRQYFYISLSWPWTGIRSTIGSMNRNPAGAEMIGVQEFFFIVLSFVCTVACWLKLRPAYSIWMTGNWLLFTSATFVASVPRYTLVMFPIHILFAMLAVRRFWNSILTVWSLLFLALFISLFVRGFWAF